MKPGDLVTFAPDLGPVRRTVHVIVEVRLFGAWEIVRIFPPAFAGSCYFRSYDLRKVGS